MLLNTGIAPNKVINKQFLWQDFSPTFGQFLNITSLVDSCQIPWHFRVKKWSSGNPYHRATAANCNQTALQQIAKTNCTKNKQRKPVKMCHKHVHHQWKLTQGASSSEMSRGRGPCPYHFLIFWC